MTAISLYFAAVGVGMCGVGAGLLVRGPIALDKRWERHRSRSRYAASDDAMDLHADRELGHLEGEADEIWRPVATVHFWTFGLAAFGVAGLGLTAAGMAETGAVGGAITAGLVVGYLCAALLRGLPDDEPER